MRAPVHSIGCAVLLALLAAGAGACSDASSDPGANAMLRLSGTGVQYVPGALGTDPAADSPTIISKVISTDSVFPGVADRPLNGSALGSTSVLIGLAGDVGHWVAPTGQRDTDVEGAFDFSTRFSLSPLLPLDPSDQTMIIRAVDAQGQVGPPVTITLKVRALGSPLGAPVEGQPLVVTLQWDTEADLDLKVRITDPSMPDAPPIDIWTKHRVALPPLGPADPPYLDDQVKDVGALDYDSNASCVIDGIRQENVIFTQAPPSPKAAPPGLYEVRVDATSLCGQVTARWHAYAIANGTDLLGEAYGQAIDIDTQGSHGPATGTLAFSFMVP
jgi:hypothetical protein